MTPHSHSNANRPARSLRALRAALFIAAIAGCGGGGGTAPPSEGQATVDAAGATVAGPAGVSLTIPPLAVASSTTFRIARNSTGAPPLTGMTLLSPIYEVTPHGASFDPDALLTLPYDASLAPAGTTPVVLRGEPDGSWHVQPLRSTSPGTALVDVSGLSWYAVGVCTPGDAGVFGFGIGDCPANAQLRLEYLNGSGNATPVPRAVAGGYALPFDPPITAPTDVTLRVSWTRPAGVDRVDTIRLYGASSLENFQQDANEQVFTRDVVVHIDPTQVSGAGLPNGIVKRYFANVFYCFQGFVIGQGNQSVCWNFDTDVAFRVHDTSSPGAPSFVTQPLNRDVMQGDPASFTLTATAAERLLVNWQRFNPANGNWMAAGDAAVFARGGVQTDVAAAGGQPGGSSFTIAATALADDQARLRAQVCDNRASGSQTCVLSNEVRLGVLAVNAVSGFPVFTQQPQSASVVAGQTYSLNVSATSSPGPDIVIGQVGGGVVHTCPGPGLGATSNSCSYSTAPLTLGQSGLQFVATATTGRFTSTSQTVTATVTAAAQPPSIASTDPADVTVPVGTPATFSVNATGTAPLNYQWSCDAGPIGGANGSSVTLAPGQPAYFDGAQCSVVVSNGASPAGVQSRSALLTLSAAPLAILRQPAPAGVVAPASASFAVLVNNPATTTYQWQRSSDGGATWSGVGTNAAGYTTPPTSTADSGALFRVVVDDGSTSLTSASAALTVVAAPASGGGACFNNTAGWCYVQPAPLANTLTDLLFDASSGTALAFGQAGTLMRSTDRGSSWTVQWDASRIWWVDVVQPASGVLVGVGQPWQSTGGGTAPGTRGLYRSVDAGNSWTLILATDALVITPTLAFADANVGVVSMLSGPTPDILRTNDGGMTWSPVHLPANLVAPASGLARIGYAGNNTFVGVGGGVILRSTDAGLTWSLVSAGSALGLIDLAFGGTGLGVAVDNSQAQVLRTSDYGATWTAAATAIADATSVAFADANTAVIFGQGSALSRSTDGGASWSTPDLSLDAGPQSWRPRFADATFGLAVGQYGAVARTLDGGQTWTRIAGGRLVDSIVALEAAPGGATLLGDTLGGSLLRSSDGGSTWSSQILSNGAISWGSASTAMLFDLYGRIYRSDDAGATWSAGLNDSTLSFHAGAMTSATNAIVTGAPAANRTPDLGGGVLRRTTDGGATWSNVSLPSGQWIYSARFLTPLVGLIGGENATLMRTTDGGASWNLVDFSPAVAGDTVTHIARVSDTVAILSTASEIKRSSDGGLSWTQVVMNGPLNGVGGAAAFGDANHGIAVGVAGLVLITADGGQTWSSQSVPIDFNVAAVTWANPTTPLIGGDGGALLRNTRSGLLSVGPPRAGALRAVPTPRATPPGPR